MTASERRLRRDTRSFLVCQELRAASFALSTVLVPIFTLLAAFALLSGCSKPAAEQQKSPAAAADIGTVSEAEQDKIILAVSTAIRKNHLSNREDECVSYRFDATRYKDAYVIDV